MIHFENHKLIINGNGAEILTEIGMIISRMICDFNCPPELIMDIVNHGIEQGLKSNKHNDENSFSISYDGKLLSAELKKELSECNTPEKAREIFRKYNVAANGQNKIESPEELLFKKMFGDLMNE